MYRLPPESPENSGVNETTPLLRDVPLIIDGEIYALGGAVGGSKIDDSIYSPAAAKSDAIEDLAAEVGVASRCAEKAVSETQGDFHLIVQDLFSAWLKFPQRSLYELDGESNEFFGTRALHAISTKWRRLRAQRDDLPKTKEIVQGLTEQMVSHISKRLDKFEEKDSPARLGKEVAQACQKIFDAVEEEARKERKRRRERIDRGQRIAEILRFYKPFARINFSPPLNCRTWCNFFCSFGACFTVQFPFLILLLGWPVSIGVMGYLYMTQCPVSQFMPYVMMALGVIGTNALLMRLSFVIYEKISYRKICSMWPWIVLKVNEFAFLDFLIVQMFYFYSETPSFVSGTIKYCNETFYTYVHWINYASIALVSAWIFVYFTKGLRCIFCQKFDYGLYG